MSSLDPQHVIAAALKQATVWISDADVEPRGYGWAARLLLDPNVASARAEQQGLRDKSLRAAICEGSVVDLIDSYIARVNQRLPSSCQIVSREFDLGLEPDEARRS